MRFNRGLVLVVGALAAAVPFTRADAQNCGGSTHCTATSAGLIIFGRDNKPAGFATQNFAGAPNSFGAYADFRSILSGLTAANQNSGVGEQGFEGFSGNPNTILPNAPTTPLAFGTCTDVNNPSLCSGLANLGTIGAYNDVGDDARVSTRTADPTFDNQRYPVGGNNYLRDPDDWKLTFSSQVTAFGFFGVDIAEYDLNEPLNVQIKNGGSLLQSFLIDEATMTSSGTDRVKCAFYIGSYCWYWKDDPFGSGNIFFFGFIANNGTSFDNVYFDDQESACSHNCSDDVYAYDNFYTAGVYNPPGTTTELTPEPASMTLLATGLIGLATAARRRRKR